MTFVSKTEYGNRHQLMHQLGLAYGQQDPDGAVEWALGLPEEDLMAVSSLFSMSDEMMNAAVKRINEIQEQYQAPVITNLASRKARDGIETALVWAQQYADEPFYENTVQQVVHSWSHQSPKMAADYLNDNPEFIIPGVVMNIYLQWQNGNPKEAHDWVMNLPESPAKAQAVSGVIQNIAYRDIDAALGLLSEVSDPEVRNQTKFSIATLEVHQKQNYDVAAIVESYDLNTRQAEMLRQMIEQIRLFQGGD